MKFVKRMFFAPEEEEVAGNGDLTPPQVVGIPDDNAEFVLSDGTKVTYKELRENYTNQQSLMTDYTRKTQEAAEIKRTAETELAQAQVIKADAEGNLQQSRALRNAVAEDMLWYNSHPQNEWAGYKAKSESLMEGTTTMNTPAGTPPVTATPPITTDALRVAQLEQRLNERDRLDAVDATITNVDKIVGTQGFELVTRKALLNGVGAYQAQNKGALPDANVLATIAKGIQEDLKSAGVPVPRGHIPANGSTKPMAVGDIAASVDPNWKSINMQRNPRQVEDALANVMREKSRSHG